MNDTSVPGGHRGRIDPVALTISGVMTCAWYAVPDLVRPRWVRAVLKTGIVVGGAAAALELSGDGRAARAAVRDVRDAVEAAADGPDLPETAPDRADDANPAVLEAVGAEPGGSPGPNPALLALVGAGALTLGVLGERWLYRRGEAMRARGVRAPHTRIGVVMGLAAAGMSALEPQLLRRFDPEAS